MDTLGVNSKRKGVFKESTLLLNKDNEVVVKITSSGNYDANGNTITQEECTRLLKSITDLSGYSVLNSYRNIKN